MSVDLLDGDGLIDEESDELILRLQLEDIETFQRSSKDKGKLGQTSDDKLAILEYKQELQRRLAIIEDRRMVRSIADAVQTDGIIIHDICGQEQYISDLQMASNVNGSRRSSLTSISKYLQKTSEDLVERLAIMNIASPKAYNDAESSASASLRNFRTCVVCSESKPIYQLVKLPCNHEYCNICTIDLFKSAMTDESLFPPRCCRQTIGLDHVCHFFNAELTTKFEDKSVEFSTIDRVYCHDPACSAFIAPSKISIANMVSCNECGSRTCLTCKAEAHPYDLCPDDEAAQQLEQLAEAQGWQKCYSCKRYVELNHGCNHMTCRCGAEFCYACGLQWKTCSCDQWHEDNLIARAQVIANREARPEVREDPAILDHIVTHLQRHHDCEHQNWTYITGSHACEECHHTLPRYIFRCSQCLIQACWRCRRNRL